MSWTKVGSGNESGWVDIKPQPQLSESQGSWIKTVIASNPFADEGELLAFFVQHGFPEGESKRWIACRQQPLEDF
jgi:hypothetical protein